MTDGSNGRFSPVQNRPCEHLHGHSRNGSIRNPVYRRSGGDSVDRCGSFQVHLTPVALHDPFANLGSSLALLVLGIRIIQLLQADVATGAVSIFKATVEAVVAHPIAVTVTRLLVQN